jgi:ferredoxin
MVARVDRVRCVGCGVCVVACPEGALALVRRPDEEILPPPETYAEWAEERLAARASAA